MKTLGYLTFLLVFITVSCKKTGVNKDTVPAKVQFEIVDKNRVSLVNSLNDSVRISYKLNGVSYISHLHIYRVQTSPTDTTHISKYNGFVISDWNQTNDQGYISSASAAGVRNFDLYLNGVNIGTLYWDYWGYLSFSYPPPASSDKVMLNSIPAKWDTLTGSFSDGSQIVENADSPGEFVYILTSQ
ncbi:MAG: hypothetical protein JST19_14225 [Bacteroidetes bacterium]|nr:hypothetical protein [Bacteroidota bacterium]